MIAHRVRICAADFMFSKLRANHLNALVRRTRTTRLVQGFSACPMSLTRHSSGHSSLAAQGRPRSEEAADECPEPVGERLHPTSGRTCDGNEGSSRLCLGVGIRSSTRGSSQCEFVSKAAERRDPVPLSGGPFGEAASSRDIPHSSFDEVVSAMPYRTETHRTFGAIKEAMAAEQNPAAYSRLAQLTMWESTTRMTRPHGNARLH